LCVPITGTAGEMILALLQLEVTSSTGTLPYESVNLDLKTQDSYGGFSNVCTDMIVNKEGYSHLTVFLIPYRI
jgi:hypothetical protein